MMHIVEKKCIHYYYCSSTFISKKTSLSPDPILKSLLVSVTIIIDGKLTAPFNNMRTLKFKGQLINALFATVNQMFGGSSKLPTTVKRTRLSPVQST